MSNINEIAIRPLHILHLVDPEKVWTRAAKKLNHKPPKPILRSDVVVLRPDMPVVFQSKNEKDMFIFAAFGVVVADIYHICLLSLIGDEEIESVTHAAYTAEEVEDAMSLGLMKKPYLRDGERSYGSAQLSMALQNNEVRSIALPQR